MASQPFFGPFLTGNGPKMESYQCDSWGPLVLQTSSGLLRFIGPIDPVGQCNEKAVAMSGSSSDPGNVELAEDFRSMMDLVIFTLRGVAGGFLQSRFHVLLADLFDVWVSGNGISIESWAIDRLRASRSATSHASIICTIRW